ncbi:MAG TPA: hypothetical protein VJ600_00735 [Holophagaceae bacterium]|nr:hypothetical protein [Holophagaceae bacterium]
MDPRPEAVPGSRPPGEAPDDPNVIQIHSRTGRVIVWAGMWFLAALLHLFLWLRLRAGRIFFWGVTALTLGSLWHYRFRVAREWGRLNGAFEAGVEAEKEKAREAGEAQRKAPPAPEPRAEPAPAE